MDAQGCANETKFARSCACEWLEQKRVCSIEKAGKMLGIQSECLKSACGA